MFVGTVLCRPYENKLWPVAEWSNLSFTFPKLLAHAVGCRFESYQWLFSSPLSCLLKKCYPTPHPYHVFLQLPHHGTYVRSAVLPKTTWLNSYEYYSTVWMQGTKL